MDRYRIWFQDFTREFMQGGPEDIDNVRLKRDHSFRVLDNASEIVQSIGLEPSMAMLARVAALLHDVGRFPQYARFRTFSDAVSANHARLSVDALRKSDILSELEPEHRRMVLGAIFLHNRRTFPAGLSPGLDMLTRIVRDADKLDIFSVLLSHVEPGSPHNSVVTLNLRPHPTAYSEKILDDLLSRRLCRYEEMVWINDLKLLACGWIYDMNFSISRRMLLDRGYIDRLLDLLPSGAAFSALKGQLRKELTGNGTEPSTGGLASCTKEK